MWDMSIMVDLRHGSRTAAKRLGAGGPSPGGGRTPQPGRKAFGLRGDGGVFGVGTRKVLRMWTDKSFSQAKKLRAFAMPSFQFPVKSGKSMLTVLISRIRYVPMFQTLNTYLQQTTKIITFHHLPSFLTVNRIYSQCITPCREGPEGGRKTHLQVESLLPRLSTDFSVIRSNQV